MLIGFSNATYLISDIRKTAAINNELLQLQVDIAALQETRLAEPRSLKESDYTFFRQGKKEEEQRQHGVGFAVCNTLLDKVQLGHQATDRLMSLAINTADGPINLLSAYAPTLAASAEVKDAFYNQQESLIQGISRREYLIILEDFNARVGSDNEAWPNCLGNFDVGKCNDNGQRLLELCSFQELCVANTFFCIKKHHRVSWRHPRSKHWHQLDLTITRRRFLQSFIITTVQTVILTIRWCAARSSCNQRSSTVPNNLEQPGLMSAKPDTQIKQPLSLPPSIHFLTTHTK